MATFGAWLDAQAGRGDEVGQVAKAWRDATGRRPRASAYATIARFMLADPDMVPDLPEDRLEAVLTASLAQYHAGNHQAGPAVPSPPLGDDLQVKRLQSVPDHQQPDQAGDGETAGQKPEGIPIGVHRRLDQLDERLAGLQELVGTVPAIHELLVAFMQAMVPVIELASELGASDSKLESMAGEVRDLAAQLGYAAEPDLIDSKPPMDVSPAQERARSVAESNGWIPQQQPDRPTKALDWAGGLCEIHCREDRCVYGCDCPGHKPDGTHVTQNGWVQSYQQGGRAAGRQAAMDQQAVQAGDPAPPGWGDRPLSAAEARNLNQQASQPADQGMRLYGDHIAPEPDWASMHDLGEASDG